MGKILIEDAINIFFPQTCDVLVDDIRGITILGKKGGCNKWIRNSSLDPTIVRDRLNAKHKASGLDKLIETCCSNNPQWGPMLVNHIDRRWLFGRWF